MKLLSAACNNDGHKKNRQHIEPTTSGTAVSATILLLVSSWRWLPSYRLAGLLVVMRYKVRMLRAAEHAACCRISSSRQAAYPAIAQPVLTCRLHKPCSWRMSPKERRHAGLRGETWQVNLCMGTSPHRKALQARHALTLLRVLLHALYTPLEAL
jgi:hypothetical protein